MKISWYNAVRMVFAFLFLGFLFVGSSSVLFSRQDEKPRAKAWLGVTIRDVNEETAKANKLSDESGAYVVDVTDDSPADSAGIRKKDIIVGFGQKTIDDANDLLKAVAKSKVGDKVSVAIVRNGEKKSLQVVLTEFPHRRSMTAHNLVRRLRLFGEGSNEGMQLMELNDQLGEYFGAPGGSGILVERVKKGSASDKAGIKAGDVLMKIGKRTIDDMEDVSKAFSKYDDGDKVDVEVLRKGSSKTLTLEMSKDEDDSSYEFFRGMPNHGRMFRMPPFRENELETPRFDGNDFQFDFHMPGPDIKILERNLQKMEKSLREHRNDLLETARTLRIKST